MKTVHRVSPEAATGLMVWTRKTVQKMASAQRHFSVPLDFIKCAPGLSGKTINRPISITFHFAVDVFYPSPGYHMNEEIERSRHRRADSASCGILDPAARACARWSLPDR